MDDEDQGVCREFADWEGGRGGEEGAGGGCQGVIVDVMRSWFMSWSQRVRISPAGCISMGVGVCQSSTLRLPTHGGIGSRRDAIGESEAF